LTISTNCTRCNCPVQFTGREPGEEARLLKLSKVPVGYCAACAMSLWLQHDPMADSLRYVIDAKGPSILLDRRCIDQMAKVLAAGVADARPQEIDWVSVVIHWDLPFARYPRKRKADGEPGLPNRLTPKQARILDALEGDHG
jgi:hypothetical protein